MSSDDEVKIVGKLVDIPLADLHIQYIHGVTPIDLWNRDMSLSTSPHVELLQLMRKFPLRSVEVQSSRYFQERRNRYALGMTRWTDIHIEEHAKVRLDTYFSLKRKGYRKGGDCPIKILREPFWKTRFGYNANNLHGPEIWDGGGRCTAAFVLGWKTIPAYWVEDVKPGSCDKGWFEKKLKNVKGVWDWMEAFNECTDSQDH